jgi:hypothetical protein
MTNEKAAQQGNVLFPECKTMLDRIRLRPVTLFVDDQNLERVEFLAMVTERMSLVSLCDRLIEELHDRDAKIHSLQRSLGVTKTIVATDDVGTPQNAAADVNSQSNKGWGKC